MTKAFPLNFSMKALFFSLFERKERLPKLVRQPRRFSSKTSVFATF